MEAASIAHADHHHGPPAAHQSSRVHAPTLGMLLFIISEVMIFGAFFTAYFFIRVVSHDPWPAAGTKLPEAVAGHQHRDPAVLVADDPLGAHRRSSAATGSGSGPGMVATFLLGLTLPVHPDQRVHPHRLRAARRGPGDDLLRPHRPARRARLHRSVHAADGHGPRVPRPLLRRGPPGHGGAGDLLALRRHHVGDRLHDGLRASSQCSGAAAEARGPVAMKLRLTPPNPLRSEADAFGFLVWFVCPWRRSS